VTHAAVTDAVAVVRDGELICYVTGTALPESAELCEFLAGKLPEYLVPIAVVALPNLPKDKASLPTSTDGAGSGA